MIALLFVFFVASVGALDNGVALTPVMGWSTWFDVFQIMENMTERSRNTFRFDITADLIMQSADALVASGLAAAGYKYVLIDDGAPSYLSSTYLIAIFCVVQWWSRPCLHHVRRERQDGRRARSTTPMATATASFPGPETHQGR
jgi:hypothetical protein